MLLRTFGLLGLGIEGSDRVFLSVAIDVVVLRALIVGDRRNGVFGPGLIGLLGILEPPGGSAGKVDDQHVAPAIAVDVVGKAAEGVAVALGIVLRRLIGELVHLPVGRFIPY